jgi:hypothetical protein
LPAAAAATLSTRATAQSYGVTAVKRVAAAATTPRDKCCLQLLPVHLLLLLLLLLQALLTLQLLLPLSPSASPAAAAATSPLRYSHPPKSYIPRTKCCLHLLLLLLLLLLPSAAVVAGSFASAVLSLEVGTWTFLVHWAPTARSFFHGH